MRLHPRLTGLGLAAAILGELMLAGRITVDSATGEARIAVVNSAPVADSVDQSALNHILAEPTHSLQVWLQFLARTAHADVAARMTEAGLLNPPSGRLLSRRQAPVDPNTALWPAGRLNLAIQRGQRLDTQDALLLGLIVVTTVARIVLWEPGSPHVSASIAALPAPFGELIAHTKAAIGNAVLSRR